jgi:hypothetical protein
VLLEVVERQLAQTTSKLISRGQEIDRDENN